MLPAVESSSHRRSSIPVGPTALLHQENQWCIPSVILGSTFQIEDVLPWTSTGALYSHIHLENPGRHSAKCWLWQQCPYITATWHARRGRECNMPKISTNAPTRIQNIRRATFTVNGPRVFNNLPQYIRDTTKCDKNVFKAHLDHYLQQVLYLTSHSSLATLPIACVTQIAWCPGMPSWKHSWRNPQERTLWRQERRMSTVTSASRAETYPKYPK